MDTEYIHPHSSAHIAIPPRLREVMGKSVSQEAFRTNQRSSGIEASQQFPQIALEQGHLDTLNHTNEPQEPLAWGSDMRSGHGNGQRGDVFSSFPQKPLDKCF